MKIIKLGLYQIYVNCLQQILIALDSRETEFNRYLTQYSRHKSSLHLFDDNCMTL